jgi:hypothetical protein
MNSQSPLRIAERTVFCEDDAATMIHGPFQFVVRRPHVAA